MTYRDREPDIDTPSFRLWLAKPDEQEPEVTEEPSRKQEPTEDELKAIEAEA